MQIYVRQSNEQSSSWTFNMKYPLTVAGRSQHLSRLVHPKLQTISNIWSWNYKREKKTGTDVTDGFHWVSGFRNEKTCPHAHHPQCVGKGQKWEWSKPAISINCSICKILLSLTIKIAIASNSPESVTVFYYVLTHSTCKERTILRYSNFHVILLLYYHLQEKKQDMWLYHQNVFAQSGIKYCISCTHRWWLPPRTTSHFTKNFIAIFGDVASLFYRFLFNLLAVNIQLDAFWWNSDVKLQSMIEQFSKSLFLQIYSFIDTKQPDGQFYFLMPPLQISQNVKALPLTFF